MYSEELLNKLKENNFNINCEDYMKNFNPSASPQIDYVECVDKDNGMIRVHTNDNYDMTFKVYVKKR